MQNPKLKAGFRGMLYLFLLFIPISVFAQNDSLLTLDACRQLAREHYPEIRQYELVSQTTDYTLSNARRAWLPQFTLSGQAVWQSDVAGWPDALSGLLSQMGVSVSGMKQEQYKAQLELDQMIWDGGKSSADKAIARADSTVQNRSTDVDLYAVEGRVDDLFFGILLLDEQIEQYGLTMDLLRDNLDKLRAMLRSGVAMQSDADAVEAQLLTIKQQSVQAEASRESYRRMLGIFIGRDVQGAALARPVAELPSNLEPQSPELALFDAQSDRLSARQLLIKSSTRPTFGLFAQGYYGYPGLNFMQAMMSSDWSWNAVVGVRMSWRFGAYYTKKNSLNQLRTAQSQVEVQRDIFLFNTRLQTTEQNGEITRLQRALADDDRIVALRRSVREAAESKLRNGVIDTNDLLGKITDEQTASIARQAHEVELLKAIYELKHTLNQ